MTPDELAAIQRAKVLSADVARLYQQGDFASAIPLAKQSLALCEQALGSKHPAVARSLSDLAVLHQMRGDYPQARQLHERALQIREEALGSTHPDVAASLNNLASLHEAQGSYASAEALLQRALCIFEQALGPKDPHVATSLNNLAGIHLARGAYAAAEPLYERALRIYETVHGPEHPGVATALNNLAELYREWGAYARAAPLYERALRIYEKRWGPEHPSMATSLNNLALLYQAQGEYRRAAPLYERALHIRETVFGLEHPEVATSLNNLALLHRIQGAYGQAEPLYRRALHIQERLLGAHHPSVAMTLNNLAKLHQARGAFGEAALLYERTLRINEEAFGPGHPDVAGPLTNLATIYQVQGLHHRAEPLHERALRIRENVLGAEHPDVATSLAELASLYQEQGAFREAERLHERALRIRERALGADHPEVATSLNDLGGLYQQQGAYDRAELLHDRALRIRERALGLEHPEVARTLNNLAVLHQTQGAYARAEALYQRALHIWERVLGPEHPDVAACLSNLAALYEVSGSDDQGSVDRAVALHERALRITEKALGPDHPRVAMSLRNLAMLAWRARDAARALRDFTRAVDVRERYISQALAVLPEPRKRQLLRTQDSEVKLLVSFHAHGAPDSADALALTLTATLRRKGRVLEEVISEHASLRRDLSPSLQLDLDNLQARRVELAIRRKIAEPSHAAALQALAHDVDRLESELSRKSARFRAQTSPLTIEAVQAVLPDNATLVEFVRYHRADPDVRARRWAEARYAAYLLRSKGPPQWLALGEADPIDEAVASALASLARSTGDAREPLRALDELIFAPIRHRLGSTDHFLISPDAALHLVPFAALVDEQGRYLAERLLITYLTSGRDVVRTAAPGPRSRPLVVAVSDFPAPWKSIPGAEAEAKAIQKHFTDVDLYLGPDATKPTLSAARGPQFIHVATHGYFRPPRAPASTRSPAASRSERDIHVAPSLPPPPDDRPDLEDTLDDAGLVFAGASETEACLTAREIAGIDLRGTQLVVLSACDTGIGQIALTEGVYGLRRALAIAGAETQVVSLWKVDDDATCRLMDRYYGALRGGAARSEALRQAQRELMHEERYAHPFYWAAFIPIGNPGPLRRTAQASGEVPDRGGTRAP